MHRVTSWMSLLVVAFSASVAKSQPRFTIAVIPDTQNYCRNSSGDNITFFAAQTRWIVDHAADPDWNIVFATHLGDIVNNAGSIGGPANTQWNVAVQAMSILRLSTIPHSILPGNHDWTSTSGTGSLEHYRIRFGDISPYYAGKPWFMGYDARGANAAQVFSTPIGDLLHLALEWNFMEPASSADRPDAPADGIAWAQAMIDAHPGVPTIISTHNNVNTSGVRDRIGQLLFDRLVAPNNQVFMVLNGHYSSATVTERLITSVNHGGRPVYEMLTDYQARNRGGDGWMRLLVFDSQNNIIQARTYTPITQAEGGAPAGAEYGGAGRVETDADSQFTLPLDFATRFLPPPPIPAEPAAPAPGAPILFKQGVNGYTGTSDTEIRRDTPTTARGSQGYMHIDTNEGGTALQFATHGLIRFDGLFGPGVNQLADDRGVLQATLRLAVHEDRSNSGGSGFAARRMLVNWNEATTWSSSTLAARGAGIGVNPATGLPQEFDTVWFEPGSNGAEGVAAADAAVGADEPGEHLPQGRWLDLDVTRGVRAFQAGAVNYGWLLQALPNTTDATRVESSESELPGARFPELRILPTAEAVTTQSFTQGVDTWIAQASPNSVQGSSPTLTVSAAQDDINPSTADSQALIRFTGLFGAAPSQIRPGSRIASAILKVNVSGDGSGFAVHQLLREWDPLATWNSMGGGILADGVEAAFLPDDRAGYQRSEAPWNAAYVQAGVLLVDVTTSVRRWSEAGGEPANHGWALLPLPNGANSVVLDSFNSVNGAAPELMVRFVPAAASECRADVDGDGLVTSQDLFDFLTAYFANNADFNTDGMTNSQDFFDYLAAFFVGC